MATRTRDDRENPLKSRPALADMTHTLGDPSRRPALAPLNTNILQDRALRPKLQTLNTLKGNNENRQPTSYKNEKPLQPPIVQFQAFGVYESTSKDTSVETKMATRAQNIKQKENQIPNNVLKLPTQKLVSSKNDKENVIVSTPSPLDTSMLSVSSLVKSDKKCDEKMATASTLREQFFHVPHYRKEIYGYMRELEVQKKYRARPDYMRKQTDITLAMRAILVDWLVEVGEEYRLQTETLYLAVSYIDRFLSYMAVVRAKLQLVGTTAMFIASKFEEIYPPELREFVYITDETYTKQQVLRMEHLILKVLSFDLSTPTPLAFISLFCITNGFSQRTLYLAMYISELALLEAEPYLMYHSSILGAAALAVARHTLFCCHCTGEQSLSSDENSLLSCSQSAWPITLQQSSGYSLSSLESCMKELTKTHLNALTQPHQAIIEKYKSDKYDCVAHIKPKSMYFKTKSTDQNSTLQNTSNSIDTNNINK